MKLYGKELDDELAIRKKSQDERRAQKLTIRKAAEQRGIKPSDLMAYERGEDVCPHEKWIDQVGGVPVPKFILKICAKCGKPDEESLEKINDGNKDRAAVAYINAAGKKTQGKE